MIRKLLIDKTNNVFIQLLRYLFAGGVAFGVDMSILWLLTEHLHIHYLISTVISFLFGLITSYLISILWVFDEKRIQNRTIEITIFGIIGGVGLLLTSFFYVDVHFRIVSLLYLFKNNYYGNRIYLEFYCQEKNSFH